MIPVYETREDAARVSPNGWTRLPSGTWVCRVPYVDTDHPGIFAHLDRRSGLAVGERDGVRLVRPETLQEIVRVGHWIDPIVLPDAAQRTAMPRAPGEARDAYEKRIRREMSSYDWCARHDFGVWAELAATEWTDLPVVNAGKLWIGDEHKTIAGWPTRREAPPARWLQPPQAAHLNGLHKDYGTLCVFESEDDPGARGVVFPGWTPEQSAFVPPSDPLDRALSQLGVKEETGQNDGAAIAKFFAGATRNGRPTGWRSGWDWCAAFFGWCGGPTWRIAVHEYVTDARAAGTLRIVGDGYEPKPGDGVILTRVSGESPLVPGGQGHICRFLQDDGGGVIRTIGGNENNRVQITPRSRTDARILAYMVSA